MTETALRGAWIKDAKILCARCHGPYFPFKHYDVNSEEWQALLEPQELKESNATTRCHVCDRKVQVYANIAMENNLAYVLFNDRGIKAAMAQTGGMNSACEVETVDGWYWITFDFDGDKQWWMQRYDSEGEDMGEKYRFVTKNVGALVDHIESSKHIMRWI